MAETIFKRLDGTIVKCRDGLCKVLPAPKGSKVHAVDQDGDALCEVDEWFLDETDRTKGKRKRKVTCPDCLRLK